MPWTTDHYPDSMKNLDLPVREKAIDIANALVEGSYDEGHAIAIAIAQAKRWAENNDTYAQDLHVVPHPDGWAISREGNKRAGIILPTKEDARNRAIEIAQQEGRDVVIHDDNGRIENYVDLIDPPAEPYELK